GLGGKVGRRLARRAGGERVGDGQVPELGGARRVAVVAGRELGAHRRDLARRAGYGDHPGHVLRAAVAPERARVADGAGLDVRAVVDARPARAVAVRAAPPPDVVGIGRPAAPLRQDVAEQVELGGERDVDEGTAVVAARAARGIPGDLVDD